MSEIVARIFWFLDLHSSRWDIEHTEISDESYPIARKSTK